MDVYETTSNSDIRSFPIPTKTTTVARFIAQMALALKLPSELSANVFGLLITYAICEVVDNVVVALFEVRVDCRATYYDYYGKDTASGKNLLLCVAVLNIKLQIQKVNI